MSTYPKIELLINGVWRGSAHTSPILNPSDERALGELPHASIADLDEALAAAERGFAEWRRVPPIRRENIMLDAARLLRARAEEIAHSIALDQGKPIAQGRAEVIVAAERIEWDASEGRRLYGRIVPAEPGLRHSVLREPLGVVAAFTPWNYPIASPTRKVAGALAAGCSIVLKGAEETPSGAMHLVRAFHDAGVPKGAVNLVFGNPAEISAHLIPKPGVRLITFTGSVPRRKASSLARGPTHEACDYGARRKLAGNHLRRCRSASHRGAVPSSANLAILGRCACRPHGSSCRKNSSSPS
ncbi:MAG: aldehyde dehydrogenase family protein [Rhizomicrobium sp.]